MEHTIIHFEIPADDVEKLKEFYSQVFGWKLIDIPELSYVMIHTAETDERGMLKGPGVNGGLYKRTERSQVPINYIWVESVDDYLERVKSNGGSVLAPKTHIPTVGYTAWIADPEGNPLGLIQPDM